MQHLVGISGYVAWGDDVTAARRALPSMAARMCRDRRSSRDAIVTFEEHVLFDGRFGVATVFESDRPGETSSGAVVVDATGAAVALGEVWAPAHAASHGGQGTAAIARALRNDPEIVSQLNGAYAAVVYDDRERAVRLSGDRLGLHPLYFADAPGLFLFGSSILSLLAHPAVRPDPSEGAIAQILYLGFLADDGTYVSGVQRLPGGSTLLRSAERQVVRRYWAFDYRPPHGSSPSIDDYAEQAYDHLRAAARRLTPHPAETGVLLSGGLDSRATLGVLVHEFGPRFLTCTYGLTETSDVQTARKVAGALGCRHDVLTLEGQSLVADLLNALVAADFLVESRNAQMSEVTRRTRAMAPHWYSGFLLDATFGGYWLPDPATAATASVPDLLLDHGPQPERFAAVVGERFAARAREAVAEAARRSAASFGPASIGDAFERFMIAYRHRGFHVASHSQLRPGERQFLMCDYELWDFYLQLPVEMRRDKKLYVHMLARKWPELRDVVYANTGARVGEPASEKHLARRRRSRAIRRVARKVGLGWLLGPSPYHSADKAYTFAEQNDIHRLVESVLLSDRALSRPHVDADGVRQLVGTLRTSASAIRLLFRLLRLELLIRTAIEHDDRVFREWGVDWHAGEREAAALAHGRMSAG